MGADLSTDEAVFAQKYRERFGEEANPDDLLEQYRYEKLKRDQELRAEELQRQRENERSKSDDEQYYRKKQEENYKIMRQSYDRSRDYYRRRGESDRHRSHRSRRHRDDDYRRRRSSRRRSSRDRSRSRRSTSGSSDEKENRRQSKKSRHGSFSSGDENKHKHSRKSGSKKEARRSSQKEKRDSSSEDDKRKSKSGSRKKKTAAENPNPKQVQVKKKKKKKKKKAEIQLYQSAPDLTEMDRQYGRGPWWRTHEYFGRYEQGPQSWIQQLSRDRDGAFPTPVMERQIVYGLPSNGLPSSRVVDGLGYPLKEKGPGFQPVPYQTYLMQKATRHGSMEFYNTPTSNIRTSSALESPTVKLPPGAVPAVGIASTAAQPVKVVHQPVLNAAAPNASTTEVVTVPKKNYEVQAHLPAKTDSALPSKFAKTTSAGSSLPPMYKTPPGYATDKLKENGSPMPKPRSKSPHKGVTIQKERKSKKASSPRRVSPTKSRPPKITAEAAREDLEVLLASDYDMTKLNMSGEYSMEFPPVFPQTYRANQEIYVDDVVFRQHPRIKELSGSESDSSDEMTDEEHVLTLGEDFSPNSVGYSSGYDLEIPEGFQFDSSEKGSVHGERSVKPRSAALLESAKRQQKADRKKAKKEKRDDLNTSKGTQTKPKTNAKTRPLVLGSIEPVTRPDKKSHRQRNRHGSPRRSSPQGRSLDATTRGRQKSKSRDRANKSTSSSPRRRIDKVPDSNVIHVTNATLLQEVPKAKHEKHGKSKNQSKSNRRNKKIQHPSQDESYVRIVTPSLHWVPKAEPKKVQSVAVGTVSTTPQKSIGIQTPKSKQPAAQPIYFLKPISAQEVFIETSVTTRSETDMSLPPTASAVSSDSTARSGASWSKSSTSGADFNEQSEIGSVVHTFQRNSQLYSSNHIREGLASEFMEPQHPEYDPQDAPGNPSVTLGVSESIQASSYMGRAGKVFCLTRSRAGSSPASTLHRERRMHSEYTEDDTMNFTDEQQVEPTIDTFILARNINDVKEDHRQPLYHNTGHKEQNQDSVHFNPTEVGKWVLDCYAHDQKLTKQDSDRAGERMHEEGNRHATSGQRSEQKQNALDLPLPPPPSQPPLNKQPPAALSKIAPLTKESLVSHQGGKSWQKKKAAESETDASLDIASDVGTFQRELLKTRHKLRKRAQEQSADIDPAEEYKHRLKQWNDSPTANVVLREVQAVTDLDSTLGSKQSPNRATSPRQSIQLQPLVSRGSAEHNFANRSNSQSRSLSSSSSASLAASPRLNAPLVKQAAVSPNSHKTHGDKWPRPNPESNRKNEAGGIDRYPDGLGQERPGLTMSRGVRPVQQVPLTPDEDWRVVSPHGSMTRRMRLSPRGSNVDINDNVRSVDAPKEDMGGGWRRSVDSRTSPTVHQPKHPDELMLSKSRTLSVASTSTSRSSPVANPFRKMDDREISSYVESIPNRGSAQEIDSEKQLLKSLEQARDRSKKESLEERTARILGIHRKQLSSSSSSSASEEDEDPEAEEENLPRHEAPKRDLNDYMNNLLTGVTEVSPATRHRYYAKEQSQNVISPLATKSHSSVSDTESRQSTLKSDDIRDGRGLVQDKDESDSAGSEVATVTESYSVNVSDSVLEASIDCKVVNKVHHGVPRAPPAEYKIPDNVAQSKNGQLSPRPQGGVMASYATNIYADTPGFHRTQQSFDTTESEGDTDLDASYSRSLNNKGQFVQNHLHQRRTVQESPVPIANNSAPLTERELEIVRELCDRNTSQTSSSSESSREKPTDMPERPGSRRLGSPSPSRELAKDKIAKSIGFTLRSSSPPRVRSPERASRSTSSSSYEEPVSYEEYDIKILSVEKRDGSQDGDDDVLRRRSLQQVGRVPKVGDDHQWTNEIQPSHGQKVREASLVLAEANLYVNGNTDDVKNAMESVGLDPSDAWLVSV